MNKIKTSEPKPLWKIRCTLGEGTLWVSEHNSIYFVDIKKKKICSLNIKSKKKKILQDCVLQPYLDEFHVDLIIVQ